jgi:hypothetical protein
VGVYVGGFSFWFIPGVFEFRGWLFFVYLVMNKGRRHEIKMLKYKKRLAQLKIKENPLSPVPANYHAFRSHGKPCSCFFCRGLKYRDVDRKKMPKLRFITGAELVSSRSSAYEYLLP